MPELPEVETIRRCIEPKLVGQTVTDVTVRNSNLRWPVPEHLGQYLTGTKIIAVERRAKYLLIRNETGSIIVHLGMSGRLLINPTDRPAEKHDHVDFILSNGKRLRYHDPRRFGCVLWTTELPSSHPLLNGLGREPLEDGLTGAYLFGESRRRSLAVKAFLMNSRIVVGIGNIYANEALFAAGIHPSRQAGRISLKRYQTLARAIKKVLGEALRQGGTTLRDYCDAAGNPGYFQLKLMVYDRTGKSCRLCGTPVQHIRQGQRSTYFCKKCQH